MKKETKAYISNVVKSNFFLVDFINVILGIAILILAFLSILEGGQMILFSLVFLLGMLLMLLNCYKSIRKKSMVMSIAFGAFAVVLAAAAAITFQML